MDNIRLKVMSDGTIEGTYILDQDGRVLDNVIKVEYKIDMDGNPQIHLTLVGVPVSIQFNPEPFNDADIV